MENILTEAVEFKDIEAKKVFNLQWVGKFRDLLSGKELNLVKIEKTSTSKYRWYVNKVFVSGSDDPKLRFTIRIEAINGSNKRYFSISDFKEPGYKKEHLECADADLTIQTLGMLDAYDHAYNEAAKASNSKARGEERRDIRTSNTADAVLKSQNCDAVKAWLAEHISKMHFELPICSDVDEVVLDDTLGIDEFERLAEKWQAAADKFLSLWKPRLVEGEDFGYRDAVAEPESVSAWYKFRGPTCLITFDCDLSDADVPMEVDALIQLAKRESEANGVDRYVLKDVQGNKLDSYYAGRAIGKIFDYDIGFYKNKAQQAAADDGTDELPDNPFRQEFDAVDAFGDKMESLTEAAEKFTCCICGEKCYGYGNNPEPFMSAEHGEKCCQSCNLHFVIPKRLELLAQNNKKED